MHILEIGQVMGSQSKVSNFAEINVMTPPHRKLKAREEENCSIPILDM